MASLSGSLRITRDDVIKAIGAVDDVTIAQIIATGATVDELAEAQAWMANDEPMMNSGRPLATGRVRELVDILAELEPDDDEDGRGAPAAVDSGVRCPGTRRPRAGAHPVRSVQLTLRHRRFELGDLGGLRRLAVEGQHVAFARDHDAVAVGDFAGEDHLGHRVLQVALDHPLQGPRAIGGIPALGGQPVARRRHPASA